MAKVVGGANPSFLPFFLFHVQSHFKCIAEQRCILPLRAGGQGSILSVSGIVACLEGILARSKKVGGREDREFSQAREPRPLPENHQVGIVENHPPDISTVYTSSIRDTICLMKTSCFVKFFG